MISHILEPPIVPRHNKSDQHTFRLAFQKKDVWHSKKWHSTVPVSAAPKKDLVEELEER
jgi:hypothetical protein